MIIDQFDLVTVEAGATTPETAQEIRSIDPSRLTLVLQARVANAAAIYVGVKKGGKFMELAPGATFGRDIFSPNNQLFIYGTAGDLLFVSEGYQNK